MRNDPVTSSQRRGLLLVAALCAITFLALADAAEDAADTRQVWALDRMAQRLVQSTHDPTLDWLMRGASWLGSGWALVPISLLGGFLLRRRDPRWALFLPLVSGGAVLVEAATKWIVARPRPNLAAYGFPSGHVLASVVVFGAAAAYFWVGRAPHGWRWVATGAATLVVTAVAYSRLYLNAHWLTDILGSLTGGVAYLLFALTWLEVRRAPPHPQRPSSSGRVPGEAAGSDVAWGARSRIARALAASLPTGSSQGAGDLSAWIRSAASAGSALRPARLRAVGRRIVAYLLALFFMALAVSITATQVLQTLLLGLMPFCGSREQPTGRALWTDLAPLRRNPLTPPFLVWTALTVLAALASGDAAWSLWIARDALRITIFYVALWYVHDTSHANRLWQGFLVTLAAMAGYGLVQAWWCHARPGLVPVAWLAQQCTDPDRVRGPFSIYMTFADMLMVGALVLVAYLVHAPTRRWSWMAPVLVVTVAALGATYARHAWIGLVAGIVVILLPVSRRQRVGLALLAVALLAVAVAVAPPTIRQRVRSVGDRGDATVRDRLAMWQSGLLMIRDHPVLGVGPGEVRAWYPAYRQPGAVRPSTGHLHSSPVEVAAERGLPALAVWLWIWITFFRHAGRLVKRLGPGQPRERALTVASLAGVTGFLVGGLFQHTFGDAQVVMLVYALMAFPFTIEQGLTTAPAAPES
jgi:undecaprenyl-diphosphatase